MKKLSTLLIIAFALVLGLTQCKKKVDTIATPSDLGKTVYITVNVGDGDRHIVYPGTGAVVYTDGDKIYVGDGKKYLGTLTYGSGAFSGTITEPAVGDYLYFYFLGGLELTSPSAGTTSYSVSIANQSSKLPVLSFGRSTSTYTTSTATYGCTLLNKCGLVKFVPATATPETVKVGGMKTTATIDFANPGISPTDATGKVTLYAESDAAKWAILLVQDEVSTPTVTIAGYNSTIASVPAVTENMYYTNGGNGVSIAMEPVSPYIDAEFTVAQGTTVKFSKGNLQYLGTGTSGTETPKWRFADNQWDYMGNGTNGNVAIDEYSAYNTGSKSATPTNADKAAARDLFGWGTSGWNNGNYFYQPYNTSDSYSYTSSVGYGYGPTDGSTYTYSLTGTYANADWGVYNRQDNQNKIEGGGNHAWRTLTSAEWAYLFNTRSNTTVNNVENARFTKTAITTPGSTTVNGLIIFPDSYSGDTPSGVTWGTINGTSNGYTTTCTADGWAALEAAGCVFLPAAGYRSGNEVRDVGSYGRYWSSTYYDSYRAYRVAFDSSHVVQSNDGNRYIGCSVRLVFEESRICPCQ
ncbi:MAG: hypothetical protein SPK72_06660 [Bacteroidales bacterium]|nr:hypothetical protein [Bacteroidales bacterium]